MPKMSLIISRSIGCDIICLRTTCRVFRVMRQHVHRKSLRPSRAVLPMSVPGVLQNVFNSTRARPKCCGLALQLASARYRPDVEVFVLALASLNPLLLSAISAFGLMLNCQCANTFLVRHER